LKIDNSPCFKFNDSEEKFDADQLMARELVRRPTYALGHAALTVWEQLMELAPFMVSVH